MDTLNPGAAVAPRWAHRGALVLLAALTATTLVAVRADRPWPDLPPLPASRRAALLLSVSDGLLTAPLRIVDEREDGQLTPAQAAFAVQASAERARNAFRKLGDDRPHEPSPELATATSAAATRIRTLTLALDRLANGLRADDTAAVRHLVATQLAPATVDVQRALTTLAAAQSEAERRQLAWVADHGDRDRTLIDAALAAGWAMTLGLLWLSTRLRRQTAAIGAMRPRFEAPAWRDALRLGVTGEALEGIGNALVRAGAADLVCVARTASSADALHRLVIRQVAARSGMAAPPWVGDLLLLPGRHDVLRALRAGEPQVLGRHLSDLGTTFAWRGCATCARAVLLPIWHGPVLYGCLALFSASADAFDAGEVQQLQAIADGISTTLGRDAQQRSSP